MLTQATEMDYKCGSCMHGIRRFGTKEVLCVPATRLKFNEEMVRMFRYFTGRDFSLGSYESKILC